MEHYQQLKERLAEVADIDATVSVLVWDMRTYMPPGGAEGRAEQLATLEKIAHQKFTAPEIGELIEKAREETASLPEEAEEAALVRMARREYDQQTKLPSDLVERLARTTSLANQTWVKAKAAADFSLFAPILEEIVDLQIEKANALGYRGCPYDALLDLYEPEMKTSQVRALFAQLREGLVPIVRAIADSGAHIETAFLEKEYEVVKQEAFTRELLQAIGYDFTRGRQDATAHPFTTSFSPGDVRVTNRFLPNRPTAAIFAALHEGGHGLYEQGLPERFQRTPLGHVPSLGLHESQSRLWENVVGRSLSFWEHWFPRLAEVFPEQLAGVGAGLFYRAINRVTPSPIRIQADEVTYNLHILLRFEIEVGLIDGTLKVADLPEIWNARMEEFLGFTPRDAAEGVLQDIHWSEGYFGYFPTYTLGSLLAVQFYRQALQERPELRGELEQGQTAGLLAWLRERIHAEGGKYLPVELVRRVTGGELQAAPFLAYLKEKYGPIYGI
jgi:carboxypeptidase Taq